MREYITTNIVDIYCGRIGLDENQAGCRGPSLNKIDNGVYEVLAPVQFKAGEKIKLDNPDKILAGKLDDLSPKKPVKESVKKSVKKGSKK